MKKNIETTVKIKDDFSEIIPNPKGIPCTNKNSEHLRNEHSRWKKESKVKPSKRYSELKYWQKISGNPTL